MIRSLRFWLTICGAMIAPCAALAYPGGTPSYQTDVAPFCASCHSSRSADYLAETPILIPGFDALLRGEPVAEGQPPLTKESLQVCFIHATRALAEECPTIVLIDDLHFAPDEGRALFTALAVAVASHRVLLIGTERPGVPEDWFSDVARLQHASQLGLQRLGPKDLFQLLRDQVDDWVLDPQGGGAAT